MIIKDGVIMHPLKIEMQPVLKSAEQVWRLLGQELVVTCGLNGLHSAGSYHYYGYALDFRTNYFTPEEAQLAANNLQRKIGSAYTVVLEHNHSHVQYNYHKNRG